jgi:hypothetical protein
VHAAPRQNGYRRALPLDERRERSTKSQPPPSFECADYVRGQRWRLWDGTLIKVRCGKANYCDFCASLAAQENARVVGLDAARECPTAGLTTTTRRPDFPVAELRKAEQLLWRQLRREFGPVRYLGFLEWTTGRAARSGGHRRAHLHHLVKGLPADEVESGRLELRVAELWQRFTGDAFVVECRPLRSPAGAINYLALHHHKREQAPPPGFENVKRFRPSKGYFEAPLPELRETARATMKDERLTWAVDRAARAQVGVELDRDVDHELQLALGFALRSLARRPAQAQLTLDGSTDQRDEIAELARRAIDYVRRQREARPPVLVTGLENTDGSFTITGERWWSAA